MNRLKSISSLRTVGSANGLVALLAGLISVGAVFVRLGLWHSHLSVPVAYNGDALYLTAMVKALTEGVWNYHIPRLGAPFGMDAVDFPIGCSLDFAVMKLLSVVVRNPFLLINSYWLMTVGLAAAFATLLFRFLGIGRIWAATFGIVYGIIPWVFYRNISHLNLVHFIVPAAAYLGLWLAGTRSITESQPDRLFNRASLLGIGICFAIGLTYIYWAFFACIIVAVGCLIGFARTRSKLVLARAFICFSVIGLAALANISASLVYWSGHGKNPALNYKRLVDADIYALRIRQMLTPIPGHPIPALSRVREQLTGAGFPNEDNESAASNLGTISSLGFLVLAAVAIVRPRNTIFADERIKHCSAFVIALILIAQVGGFGSLFNLFVMRDFRCYTRLSPFINLFSLGAIAVIFNHLWNQKHSSLQFSIAAVTIVAATFDQIPLAVFQPNREREKKQFYQDRQFIRKLESQLPNGSMIFQLPNTGFPPDGMHERMGPYDNARAYLHSKTLRWTWGAMDGRHDDWPKRTAALAAPEFLEVLAFAQFDGILLDRWAYRDPTEEQQITQIIGGPSQVDDNGRWIFFDLTAFRNAQAAALSPAEIKKKSAWALNPLRPVNYKVGTAINFGQGGDSELFKYSGWSVTEPRMTWTLGKIAKLQFGGLSNSQPVNLKVKAQGLTNAKLRAQPVAVYANGQKVADWSVREFQEYTASIPGNVVTENGILLLELRIPRAISPAKLGINADNRILGVAVFSITIEPLVQ